MAAYGDALRTLAQVQGAAGAHIDAQESYKHSENVFAKLNEFNPLQLSFASDALSASYGRAEALAEEGKLDMALDVIDRALPSVRFRLEARANDRDEHSELYLALFLRLQGRIRVQRGELDVAEGSFAEALSIHERLVYPEPRDNQLRSVASTSYSLSDVLEARSHFDRAEVAALASARSWETLVKRPQPSVVDVIEAAAVYCVVARLRRLGDVGGVLDAASRALELARQAQAIEVTPTGLATLAWAHRELGIAHESQGSWKEALTAYDASIAAYERTEDVYGLALTYYVKGRVLRNLEDYDSAIASLIAAMEMWEPMHRDGAAQPEDSDLGMVLREMEATYLASGDANNAGRIADRLAALL
jgi:tetratricopeptide (TPR) repeat protein